MNILKPVVTHSSGILQIPPEITHRSWMVTTDQNYLQPNTHTKKKKHPMTIADTIRAPTQASHQNITAIFSDRFLEWVI